MAKNPGRFCVILWHVVNDTRLSHAAFRTFAILSLHADREGYCWPSLKSIAADLGVKNRSSVKENLDKLVDLGYLTIIERRREDGSNTSNGYYINLDRVPRTEQGVVMTTTDDGVTSTSGEGCADHPPIEQDHLLTEPREQEEENPDSPDGESLPLLEGIQILGSLPKGIPVEEMVAIYHEEVPAGGRVRVLNQAKLGKLRQRFINLKRDLEWWRKYCQRVQASNFLAGRVKGRGQEPFKVDLEWIIGPNNYAKIMDGRFDNRAGPRNDWSGVR